MVRGKSLFGAPRRNVVIGAIALVLFGAWLFRGTIQTALSLAALPFVWRHAAAESFISAADDFDLTFANYSREQDTAGAPYADLVPPVLHHIAPSETGLRPAWQEARQSCLDLHPGWTANLWTDEKAAVFVQQNYPDFFETWQNYRYPVERVDSLRYMVLYKYGGVVLDMDLKCKRSLGPLRRFSFVAPAAVPTGLSVTFIMASKGNEMIGSLISNLKTYNKHWLWLPYPTVMFSTGCHYASTVFTLVRNRSQFKILGGTPEDPALHKLDGAVSTPLFQHLGSSSWHSFDASLIVSIGHSLKFLVPVLVVGAAYAAFVLFRSRQKGHIRLLPTHRLKEALV